MSSLWASDQQASLDSPAGQANDPFISDVSTAPQRRFSDFDNDLFAAELASSPTQAKRALEAHLGETDRRLDEAGKLGTALVSQRKALAEQLQEVEKLQAEGELDPTLRKKLVDIEMEYNDLARDSARVILPKSRVSSNEMNAASPHVPDARSGRRSVSPSKFESQATGSPIKLTVRNRKIRNQPSSRVHDIEFAAEISTSLIAQVRNLQALLVEREDEVKSLQAQRLDLEIESENLQQRVKSLDEGENRYREENWNLETRLQETASQQKEAADREKKLTHLLNLSNADKMTVQKELDEVKLSHAKLSDDHASAMKHNDIELGTVKRNTAAAESERSALQHRIDELASQNQELAKAFALHRGRTVEREPATGMSDEDFETANDQVTPEHSPPPSPVKGTPRHSMLETETIKTSLHHAQRTIQSQRNQLHREKTEKLELRRIIQDLRDDLEKSRDASSAIPSRRTRKQDTKESKKSQHLLGSHRHSRKEILLDDPEWEDHQEASPKMSSGRSSSKSLASAKPLDRSDVVETDYEAGESAFETANERPTETDDFQTGKDFTGSDDAETETEKTTKAFTRLKKLPSLSAGSHRPGKRASSCSATSSPQDESNFADIKTPPPAASSFKGRVRHERGSFNRNYRLGSEEPSLRSSPASFTSAGTPQPGQSLFAELQDMRGSDDEFYTGTPSQHSLRSQTPASLRRAKPTPTQLPNLPNLRVASRTSLSDPVKTALGDPAEAPHQPRALHQALTLSTPTSKDEDQHAGAAADRAQSTLQPPHTDLDANSQDEDTILLFPLPPKSPPFVKTFDSPTLGFASLQFESVEPYDGEPDAPTQPDIHFTPLAVQSICPSLEPEPRPPVMSLSPIATQCLEPVPEEEELRPSLGLSLIRSEVVHAVASSPPTLTQTAIISKFIEPFAPLLQQEAPVTEAPQLPSKELPLLTLCGPHVEHIEPRDELKDCPPLALSEVSESSEPLPEPQRVLSDMTFSAITVEHIQPDVDLAMISPASTESSSTMHPGESCKLFAATQGDADLPRSNPKRNTFNSRAPTTPRGQKVVDEIPSPGVDTLTPSMVAEQTAETHSRGALANAGKLDNLKQLLSQMTSADANSRSARRQSELTFGRAAQTALTSGKMDKLLKLGWQQEIFHAGTAPMRSPGSPDTTGTVKIFRSEESLGSLPSSKETGETGFEPLQRPNSKKTAETGFESLQRPNSKASDRMVPHRPGPPIPSRHRQIINAAKSSSSIGQTGVMGPPLWPASALRARPATPTHERPMSSLSGTLSVQSSIQRPYARTGSAHGTAEVHSPTKMTVLSRQSSVSSFASELESRFNIRGGEMGAPVGAFSQNTDPRMIQAITQTMIGEFLWKYTRKAGRGHLSEKRHRRYFWVHPYTRSLYWSERDPSSGRSELKAKSVAIEAVRVVTDDNPMPPGLHRKSLVIISPSRSIKFTCTTGQRHETWFNALSYLLLRTNQDDQSDINEVAENITREDVEEFNPKVGGRLTPLSRARATPSLSSYNSRTTRNTSPGRYPIEIPKLTPSNRRRAAVNPALARASIRRSTRNSTGRLSKLSGYWKSGAPTISGTLSGLRGRGPPSHTHGIYEASEVHDSAEDLREIIEQEDRQADRLENVRACCDGKHDVGTLHRTFKGGWSALSHAHPSPPAGAAAGAASSPVASPRSDA